MLNFSPNYLFAIGDTISLMSCVYVVITAEVANLFSSVFVINQIENFHLLTYCSQDLCFTSQFTPQRLHCLHSGRTEYPVFSKLYISIKPSTGDHAVSYIAGDCCVAG